MGRTARKALGALLSVAVLPACGRGGDGLRSQKSVELLQSLATNPARLPAALDASTPVVMVLVRLEGGKIVHESEPIVLRHEALGLERALAARRDTPPPYWAVQVLRDGTPRYWSPVDPVPKIRVSVQGSKRRLSGGKVALAETIVALRVPFFARSRLTFYDPAGHEAGELRFGDDPRALLARSGS